MRILKHAKNFALVFFKRIKKKGKKRIISFNISRFRVIIKLSQSIINTFYKEKLSNGYWIGFNGK